MRLYQLKERIAHIQRLLDANEVDRVVWWSQLTSALDDLTAVYEYNGGQVEP